MKLGPIALHFTLWWLKSHDKKQHAKWQKNGEYVWKRNIDALNDGIFDHQIDVVYAPKEKRLGRTLFDIHGGGYIYSHRDNNYGFASVFAEKGYDVVLLDYPLNNKHRGCDGQIRVLAKQIAYVAKHYEELGIGGEEFGIIGDSAGGHFALLLAIASCDKAVQEKLGIDLEGAKINGAALCCPVYDFLLAVNNPLYNNRGRRMSYGPSYNDEVAMRILSPKTYIESLKVPVFINTCLHDFIGEHSKLLRDDLERLGLEHTYLYLDSQDSNVDHVHNVTKTAMKESIEVNEAITAFFDRLFQEK